jgi:hypothetical protein
LPAKREGLSESSGALGIRSIALKGCGPWQYSKPASFGRTKKNIIKSNDQLIQALNGLLKHLVYANGNRCDHAVTPLYFNNS